MKPYFKGGTKEKDEYTAHPEKIMDQDWSMASDKEPGSKTASIEMQIH
jgi:hypothetical protein